MWRAISLTIPALALLTLSGCVTIDPPMTVSQAPSVTLVPANGRLNLYNHGDTDLQVLGAKLEGTASDIDQQARVVPKDGFYSFPANKLMAAAAQRPDQPVPFEVYLSDGEGRDYVATFDLQMASGNVTVDSQTPGLRLADGLSATPSN